MKPPLAEQEPFLPENPSLTEIEEYTYITTNNHISSNNNIEKFDEGSLTEEKINKKSTIKKNKMAQKTDIVSEILGPCGKWQLKAIFLIYLTKIPSSWFMACVIFTAPAPQHGEFYCKPKIDTISILPENKTDWIKIAHPIIEDPHDQEFKFDYCNVYHDAHEHSSQYFNDTTEHLDPWNEPKRGDNIIPCENFEYHPEYISVVTQFDLVCARDVLVAVTQFFHLFGVLWGGIIATKLMEL